MRICQTRANATCHLLPEWWSIHAPVVVQSFVRWQECVVCTAHLAIGSVHQGKGKMQKEGKASLLQEQEGFVRRVSLQKKSLSLQVCDVAYYDP
jgi:hypothetical protein